MFREKNWTSEQLRAKFLQIAEGEGWFTEEFEETQKRQKRQSESDASADNFAHIQALFGPPPWEFLQPGDVPDRFVGENRLGRKTIRNPMESEYKALRQTHVNYEALPKKAQFVDSLEKTARREYWLPGSEEVMAEAGSLYEALERLQLQSPDRVLEMNYRRPRKSTADHVQHGEELLLYYAVRTPVPVALVIVESVQLAPRAATGKVFLRLLSPTL